MYFIIYVSSATVEFSDTDLLSLLAISRKNNTVSGITGMLLYKGGNFMQVLEGEERTVRQTYEKICSDTRHRGIIMLLEGNADERQFKDWSMGFKNLNAVGLREVPAYSDFLGHSFIDEEFRSNPSKCHRLLLSFRDNLR